MLCREAESYCAGKIARPFFYAQGNDEYITVLHELSDLGLETVRASNFCKSNDKFPDIDRLIAYLSADSEKLKLSVGLGEFLALKGDKFTAKILSRLKDIPARCVLLLRFIAPHVRNMAGDDRRLYERGLVYASNDTENNIAVISSGRSGKNGVKALLRAFEDGESEQAGEIFTDTSLPLCDSSLKVWESSYDALKSHYRCIDIPRKFGSSSQWDSLLKDYVRHGQSLAKVFTSHGIFQGAKFPDDDYERWLYFVMLIQSQRGQESYLAYAAGHAENFTGFTDSIITSINDFTPENHSYRKFYGERKEIIRNFHEADISRFVPGLNISSLTDITSEERTAITLHASRNGMTEIIRDIYPALWAYAGDYDFPQEWMTEYFTRYRSQKLANNPDAEFEFLAVKYSLCDVQEADTRDNVTRMLDDGETFLLWVDSLGAEYVPLMKYLAGINGLTSRIIVTRANIPTITEMNRGFFDAWPENLRQKESRLDNIKHDEGNSPAYISDEIEILADDFTRAGHSLRRGDFRRYIIAGDHGASRLAVLCGHDEKYECGSKAEHSGRCCEYFTGCDVRNSITGGGYISLTDYGSFRGERRTGRELHGGGTPEEILTPVCILEYETDIVKSQGKPATLRSEFEDAFNS